MGRSNEKKWISNVYRRMKILLTGGIGYIASHVAINLAKKGMDVVIIDNLSNSTWKNVYDLKRYYMELKGELPFYKLDCCDPKSYDTIFTEHPDVDSIIHFAAFKSVPESIQYPELYYHNNMASLTSAIKAAKNYGVKNFVFSSSCTVYGRVENFPVDTSFQIQNAETPYGHTKQLGEMILEGFSKHSNLRSVSLRYFNPAGADSENRIGETDLNGGSLFTSLCRATLDGREFNAYGSDYITRDGFCVRDYIHVEDLAEAHVAALEKMDKIPEVSKNYSILNIGSGTGFSVYECWEEFCKTNSVEIKFKKSSRRPGDIPEIWADISEAKKYINWKPVKTLSDICKSHYEWFKSATNI